MVLETRVQFQAESHQRLQKRYLMPSYLTLSFLRYRSRVKLSNPAKGVVPSSTPWCSNYWKGSLQVTLDCSHRLYLYIIMLCWQHRFPWFSLSLSLSLHLSLSSITLCRSSDLNTVSAQSWHKTLLASQHWFKEVDIYASYSKCFRRNINHTSKYHASYFMYHVLLVMCYVL